MNVACPGTWRALRTGFCWASLKQPASVGSTLALAIQPVQAVRSFQLGLAPHRSRNWSSHAISTLLQAAFHHAPLASAGSKASHARLLGSIHNRALASSTSGGLMGRKDFSEDDFKVIFGKPMELSEANRIIQLVQEQRAAGKIDEEIPGMQRQKEQALAWLRENVPFDEDRAILTRLEREEQDALKPQAQRTEQGVYAESVLERIRRHNIAKREKEKEEQEAKAKAESRSLPLSREQALVQRRQESAALVKKWKEKAKEDDLTSVPQMSLIERVGPVTLLTASVIFLCVLFAENYSPPSQAARLFPSISPAAATISVLIAMNCVVWYGWRMLSKRKMMMRVFTLVPAYPYASSMIGNLFSHQMFRHLGTNMVALWFFGTNLHEDIGRGPFLAVYFGCGILASNAFLWDTILFKRWENVTLGCSGALSALLAIWCCINSDKGIRIWPLPPRATEIIQPLFLLALFISVDIYGAVRGLRFGRLSFDGNIDHVSHLAGYGAGIVAAQFVRHERKDRKDLRTQGKMQRIENATQS